MHALQNKSILIAGASFAGLATVYWMQELGADVTVVEISPTIKRGGTPVDIRDGTIDIVKRMGLYDAIRARKLPMQPPQVKSDAPDLKQHFADETNKGDIEIERDALLDIMFDAVKDKVKLVFDDNITSIAQTNDAVQVQFKNAPQNSFDLVFGCEGVHSDLRKLCFGPEQNYSHFLKAYGSVTIVDGLLIPQNTVEMFNEPGKMAVMSAYNGKTDIILIFYSHKEIAYDHRDRTAKLKIILDKFADFNGPPHFIDEVKHGRNFYFDKLSQIKMPTWSKGRIALVGDAAYCASAAAGKGGSLAIDGAAALADAFIKHDGDYLRAFEDYEVSFRPYLEQVQADAADFCSRILTAV